MTKLEDDYSDVLRDLLRLEFQGSHVWVFGSAVNMRFKNRANWVSGGVHLRLDMVNAVIRGQCWGDIQDITHSFDLNDPECFDLILMWIRGFHV